MSTTSIPSSGIRYALSFLGIVCVFALANYLHFHRHARCCDFMIPYGLPFPVFLEGGFAGIRRIVWPGIAGDFLFVFATAALIGNMWVRHSRPRANKSAV
jgi:hypothetical protein